MATIRLVESVQHVGLGQRQLGEARELRGVAEQRQVEPAAPPGGDQRRKLAADLVRAAADEQIQEAIQKLVPTIVERQIRAEIARLIETA